VWSARNSFPNAGPFGVSYKGLVKNSQDRSENRSKAESSREAIEEKKQVIKTLNLAHFHLRGSSWGSRTPIINNKKTKKKGKKKWGFLFLEHGNATTFQGEEGLGKGKLST